jgi:HAD superfamily hydrolase (TIGR01509 family)
LPIKSVLTDLGGVLIDYSFDLATAELARLAGIDPGVLTGRLVVDEPWKQFEIGRLTERDFCCHLRQLSGVNLTDAEVMHAWNSIYLGVNAEVERLLRAVIDEGVRVVAVTNTNVSHERVWREHFADNLDFLGAVYSSWEIGARKPEREFFTHVLESEQITPQEALLIDDLDLNVAGAQRLGLEAIQYTTVDALHAELVGRGVLGRSQSESR